MHAPTAAAVILIAIFLAVSETSYGKQVTSHTVLYNEGLGLSLDESGMRLVRQGTLNTSCSRSVNRMHT